MSIEEDAEQQAIEALYAISKIPRPKEQKMILLRVIALAQKIIELNKL